MRCFPRQAVESVVLLPEDEDFSEIGVKTKEIHFITAGSKGICLQARSCVKLPLGTDLGSASLTLTISGGKCKADSDQCLLLLHQSPG